jgi:uncharacterized membrane protein YagU involved in acid resistance
VPMRDTGRTIVRGSLAGVVATIAMSLPIVVARRLHLVDRQPPEEVTQNVVGVARVPLTGSELRRATVVAHLAFGSVCGVAFVVAGKRLGRAWQPWLTGPLYGVLIWALTYRSTLPLLRLVRPAEVVGARRDALMLVAHLIYGAVLGRLAR